MSELKKARRKTTQVEKPKKTKQKVLPELTKAEKIREAIRVTIFSISLGVFSFALSGLIVIFIGYYTSQMEYKDLVNESAVVIGTKEEASESDATIETNVEGETISIEQPEKSLYIPITIDDEYYRAINSEYIMFIYVPDTKIQYPVVMGRSDGHYLRYTFKGTENTAGSIYADYRTDRENLLGEENTIIVGHNRKDGTMFSGLTAYESESYRDSNPYIYIVLDGKEYVYEVFTFMTMDPVGVIYNPTLNLKGVMEIVNENGIYNKKKEIKDDDKIITLYTCNEDSSKRHIVCAALVAVY